MEMSNDMEVLRGLRTIATLKILSELSFAQSTNQRVTFIIRKKM